MEPHVILYDDDCGFCKWSLNQVLAWDRARRVRPVAIQSGDGAGLLHAMPAELRLRSFHLVSPAGAIRSGGTAAAALAGLLPGGAPLALVFRALPGPTERVYRFVADHRIAISRALRTQGTQVRDRGNSESTI